MRTNTAPKSTRAVVTHEGGRAWPHMTPIQALRRSVLSCMLFEREFYEDGAEIAARIVDGAAACKPAEVAALAVEARSQFNLRHAPLLLLCALAKSGRGAMVSKAIAETIQRADELSEFMALYWRDGKTPLSKQVKRGLALAFRKFDAYQLAKYDRERVVRLRDVLFLIHAKPKDEAQAAIWKQLVDGTLPAPDTWEVALSAGAGKRETFERLIRDGGLGYLALLRNLRNMAEAGVDETLVRDAIVARRGGAERVLPFRYVAAARAAPRFEPALDQALSEAIAEMAPLSGRTVVLVDVSQSMDAVLSVKSDLRRVDAAAALASLINGDVRMFSFSDNVVEVPPRRGMAGVDAILKSQDHRGTRLFDAVAELNKRVQYDRIIVITDEQSEGATRFGYYIQGTLNTMPAPNGRGYVINVASAQNGVGYGAWTHLDGFSEHVLRWIAEYERNAAA